MSGRIEKLLLTGLFLPICFFLSGCADAAGEADSNTVISQSEQDSDQGDTITLPDGGIVYPDGRMSLAEGSVSSGLYDPSGNLVQSGDALSVKDGVISGAVSLQQNMPGKDIEYSLIVLVDYEQKQFTVGNQNYLNYLFTLTEDDNIDIDINLPYPENAKI